MRRARPRPRCASPARMVEALEHRRLLSAGDLDPTFGAGGKVLTDLPGSLSVTAASAVLQPDLKIVVFGQAQRAGDPDTDFLVARFNEDGSPDPTFGGGKGYVTIDFGDRKSVV